MRCGMRRTQPTQMCATALEWIARVEPRHGVLTNLHIDLDYETLRRDLPPRVEPAYDGMVLSAPL